MALLACFAHNIVSNMHETPHGHVNEVKNFGFFSPPIEAGFQQSLSKCSWIQLTDEK